ncbi:uncharacterized protein LOC127754239 [Oryza glaberrima]|uniref:uncharacterized protein LOC127754239 n=1 Tax=Oryza glaberrima TaxID=4538 RepID=UPI00224C0F3D|nr:uncharacterized protein LOC127754239 [Oryza glaberrima]
MLREKNSSAMIVWGTDTDMLQDSQEVDFPPSGQETQEGAEITLTDDSQEKCDIPSMSDIERLREEEELEEEDNFQEVSYKKRSKTKKMEPAVTSRMSLRNREMAAVTIPKRAEMLMQRKNLEYQALENP